MAWGDPEEVWPEAYAWAMKEWRERASRPVLDPELGRNLDTVEKAREWISNPHNWFEERMFIMKWDGLTPKLGLHCAYKMAPGCADGKATPEIIVYEQMRLRRRGVRDKNETEEQE